MNQSPFWGDGFYFYVLEISYIIIVTPAKETVS